MRRSIILLFVLLSGCDFLFDGGSCLDPWIAPALASKAQGDVITFEATVVYLDFEGGFWGFLASDGAHYEPTALPPSYQLDGRRVLVEGRVFATPTTHLWGRFLQIDRLEDLRCSEP